MIKIGCITFHGSYNYGSSLQTYALKTAVENCFSNISYQVINYRNEKQREMYKNIFEKKDLRSRYSRLFSLGRRGELESKKELFERFNLTRLFTTENELKESNLDFDYLICGSDQVWNVNATEFDWSYFLRFSDSGVKISYACSAGTKLLNYTNEQTSIIKNELKKFKSISVRDENTKKLIKQFGFDSTICVDPTLLLDKIQWNNLISESPKNLPYSDKPFILFYDLKRNKLNWRIAKYISKKLKMPLLITSVPFPRVISCSIGMKKNYSCGPIEFLNYLSKAALVLTSSFHGTVLSCILNKPFYVINSSEDERLKSFINDVGIVGRNIDALPKNGNLLNDWENFCFDQVNQKIDVLREKSMTFLKGAIRNE